MGNKYISISDYKGSNIEKAYRTDLIEKSHKKDEKKKSDDDHDEDDDPKKKKVHKVMHEFKEGTLKSSSGEKVTDRKQAIAIAMSEAGLSKAEEVEEILKAKKIEQEPVKEQEKLGEVAVGSKVRLSKKMGNKFGTVCEVSANKQLAKVKFNDGTTSDFLFIKNFRHTSDTSHLTDKKIKKAEAFDVLNVDAIKKAEDDPYKGWTSKQHYEQSRKHREKAGYHAEQNNDAAMTREHKAADEHARMGKEKEAKEKAANK